jgi:hypothetical protein
VSAARIVQSDPDPVRLVSVTRTTESGDPEAFIWGRDKVIGVADDLHPNQIEHAIFHEYAHLHLWRIGYLGPDEERDAHYLAACLRMPRPAMMRALRHLPDLATRAEVFGASQTTVAIREAEVTGRARVVVTRSQVFRRGPKGFPFPHDTALRALAADPPRGVTKIPIGDWADRFALDFDETA